MELPQLVVELVGDYSKLMEDIKKARVEAVKQAQLLEKDLNLTIGVDDRSLKKLNEHFDLKVTHFKQTQSFFKNNPLKVYVDDRELTNLNKEFKKSSTTKQKVTRVVEVDETVVNNNKKSTSNNSDSGGKKESTKDVVDELKKGFADIRKQIRDQATGEVLKILAKPAKDFMTGFSEGIANDFGKQVSKGLRTVFAKQLGLDFKKMAEMAGESLLDAFGIKRKKTTKEKPPTSTTPENNSSVGEPLAKPSPKKRKEPEPVFESISVKVAKQNARNFSNNVRNAATINNNINPGEISSTVLGIKSSHQSLHKVLIDLMKKASNSGDFSVVEKIYKEYQIKSKEALAEINRLIALAKKNGATQEEITKLSQAKSPITRAAGKSSQISQTYQKTKRESERFETVKEAATGMGLDAIAGLRYGLDNKAFAKFGLENATAYLLSIRDAFQIKSPSKVMFSIGKNIIQGLIGGLDQAFPGVQAQVKKLFDSLTKDFAGFKISRLFDSGISGAIKYLATSAKKAIFSNTTNTIGDFAEEKLKPSVANFIKNSVNKTKSSSKNTLLDYYIKGLVGDAGSLTPDDKDGIKDFFTAVNFIKNSANKTKSSSKTPLDYIKGLVGDAGSLISDNKNGIKDFFTAKNFLNLGSKAAPFAINSVIKKSESLKSILGLVGIDSEKVNIGKDISDYFGDLINKTFKPIIDAQSGKLKSATTDFFQTIKNALSDARKKGELTLGQLFQSVATAGATSILSSLGVKTGKGDFVSAFISMLSGGSKGGFMAKILPLIVPMLGLKSLNLGETIVKILSGNSAIKPGFLMDVFKSITGVNLKQTPGFDTLKNMVGIGSKPKERLELENVNNKQIQENLKNINLSGGTTGLINNFGQTIIKEVLKNLGITGVKAGVMQGMANEQLAKLAPEISKMLGKGRLDKLMSGYTSGDVDSISKELNAFAQSKGISNLDISQIKGFVGTALAAITGLQARFNKEGFALGNSLSEGFKNSKRNWLNSIDDAAYAAKKALGQANMQDVGENVKKRLSRGSVIPVEMFDEFYGHLGRTVKKAIAPKNYSKEQQDALGSDAAGSAFSQSAILVPIQTMASAIAPLFLPLLPIIQTAKMMADSLFPYVNKLVDMAQRVEPIQRQLNFAGGGTLGGKAELDYVRSVGKKYNTSVEFGAGAYGQLQVAARGTKMAGEGVRELYEGISASLNKLGISGQQQSLIFMAYTQMLAKGRVSMEELRQQLGEKFPPAMSVFAKAMGLSIPAMVEMVSNGGVLSDEVLPKVGKVLLQEFGGVVNSANSVIDALARLSNAGFDIAVGLTNSFGGAMAGAINVLTSGLNVISNSISKISSIVSTSLITMVIATTVGLKTVLRQNPIAGAVSTLQNFLMSSFKNMTMALAPFILGIVVDFGDTMIGAQKDIGDNMAMGVTNMIRGAAGVLEKLQRDWTRLPLFGDVIGKENKNPLSGLIEGVKSLTKILPSGVVELGALTFMLQSLGVLLKAKVFESLGSAIGGMVGAVGGAVKNLVTTMSGLRVLFANTATMNFGDFAKREAMINAAMGARVALMEKLRVAAMALASVMTTVGAAFLLLSFAKGDFTNPLGDSVDKMAKGVNDSISTMKSSLAELAEKFKTVGDSAENAAKKFIQLPSKGAELNPQYLLGMGGKSIKFDDVVNKGDKQDGLRSNLSAFLTNIFTPVDESKTPVLRLWDKVKPLFGRRNQQEDVKKALAEAKSYGIEEFFTGKESFLNISKSQTLGTFRDVRSSVKGFEKELSNLGLLGGEKELLAKNKDLGRQINIIKDIDKKLITLGKERQVLAQRRDSKSIIKVGELDKKAVDLQVQRDKELKPLSRFSSAAEQATTFVKDLREEINKSTAPLQLKIKLLDEIKPLEDFARRASAAVKKYLPVNFAENNYKELAAGLKDAQINYEAAKNNAEINLSGRQKDLYSSNNLPGQISYENTLAQIEEQETQAKNLSTALKVKTNTLREMSAIINVDREQDRKKEMDDLKKQIADDTVNLGRLTSDIAKSKFDLTQSLYQQNKQVQEYYLNLNKQAQEITQVYKELVNTNNLNTAKNKLRSAILGYQDNFITQFTDSLIQILDVLNQPVQTLLQGQNEVRQAQNTYDDAIRQNYETRRGQLKPVNNFSGSAENGNGGIVSPIQGATVEDLLRYRPSYQQGFFGSRDRGARQHSKVDFDSRAKAGQGAGAIASLPGVATSKKWTGNSGAVFVNSVLPSGQKITLEYGHLSLASVKDALGGIGKQVQVQAGQRLGNVTMDSLSTGAHLDFGVRVNGKYTDPQRFMRDFKSGKYGTPQNSQSQNNNNSQDWLKTVASNYGNGDGFHGKKTSNGEIFNKNAMTAAMNESLKKQLGVKWGDMVEAVNPKNGKSVTVRINDHGPYERRNGKFVPHSVRGLDLSAAAAKQIGISLGEVQFRVLGKDSKVLNASASTGSNNNGAQEFVNPQLKLNLQNARTNAQSKLNISKTQSDLDATALENKSLLTLELARMENRRSPLSSFREIEDMRLNLSHQNPQRDLSSQKLQIERTGQDKLYQLMMDKFRQENIKGAAEKSLSELSKNTTLRPDFKIKAMASLKGAIEDSEKIIEGLGKAIEVLPELTKATLEKANKEYLIAEKLRENTALQQLSQSKSSGLRSKARGNLKINAQADLMDLSSKYTGEVSGLNESLRRESKPAIKLVLEQQKQQALINTLISSNETRRNLKIGQRDLDFSKLEKLNSSNNAISSEQNRGLGLFGIKDREMQKLQSLAQIKMDFEREKIEIAKLGESGNYSSEEISKLTDNLNKLNELKLDNVAKEFSMFTEAIGGVKGDVDGIFKDFFMNTKSFGESISAVFQSILNNLANMASKELSNQLFSKLLGGGSNKGSGGGIFSLFGGLFGGGGGGSFSPGAFDFSSGFDFGGGLDFGSATLPSFAKGGMVGDLMNKERAVSGFNPRLIIANEGERVLTPAETKIWNQMQANGELKSFSSGGMVGQGLGSINNMGRGGDNINITPNIVINNEGGGNINKAQFEKALEAKIQETIKQERRPGGSLNRGGLYDR